VATVLTSISVYFNIAEKFTTARKISNSKYLLKTTVSQGINPAQDCNQREEHAQTCKTTMTNPTGSPPGAVVPKSVSKVGMFKGGGSV
jgi:hypothetical protein